MSSYAHDPSASKRLTGFVLFLIGVALTIGLFYVKTRAQTAKQGVAALERSIEREQAAIAVLEAELAYRQSPERIAELAEAHLGQEAIKTSSTVSVEAIIAEIPLRDSEAPNE
jgi:hypothetical protein